jgi:hypothetical protein
LEKQCSLCLATYQVGTRLRNGLQMMNVTAPLRQSTDWHGQAKKFSKLFLTAGHEKVCVLAVIDLHYGKEGNI